MTEKEKAIQRALGLLQSWAVCITGKDFYRKDFYENNFIDIPKTSTTIIVQAISREHALAQVCLANIIPLKDLKWAGSWQCEIFANHCREAVAKHGNNNIYGERIYFL